MTNFNNATKSFTLHAEGTESYAWAWEGIDRVQCLSEIEHTNNDIVAYAHGWACELCHNCIAQIDPEGERGFTAEEITNDLIDDRHSLARALEAWLGDNDDSDDDNEEGEETSDEAYLGESTLAKIRGQKVLLLEDRDGVDVWSDTPRPFIVAFGGADNAEGGIAEEPIYAIYSSAEDYVLAGNNITESQRDGIWVNFAAIYLFHRPVGGYILSLEEEKQILF